MRTRGLIAAGALCVSAAALAYVLPGYSILRRLAGARDELHLSTVRVDGSVSFFGQTARSAASALGLPTDRPEVTSDAAVLLKPPGRCRFDVTSLEGGKVAAVQSGGHLRLEGAGVPAITVALRQICALLGLNSSLEGESRAALDKHLRSLRIEPDAPTSLARFGGQVTYVLGSAKPGSPQFWVYKDNFLPARVWMADEDKTVWDVRLLDYSSSATGEWFPRLVEVYQGDQLQLRFTALKADTKSALPDKLF